MGHDKGKDKGAERLRRAKDDLYDVWADVKGRLDDANETFEAFRVAVQGRYDAIHKDSMAARNGMGTMLQRIERRRLNIDAVLRSRPRPFPNEKGTASDLLAEARALLATFERITSPDVAGMFDGVDEELAEKEFEAPAAVKESEDAALLAELGTDEEAA